MDALVGEVALVLPQFVRDELGRLYVEHAPVVRQRHVDVRAKLVQRLDKRRRNIGHAAGFRGHLARKVAHSLRKIRDLRSDNQDSRIFHLLLTMLYWYIPVLLRTLYQKQSKSGTGKK